MSNKIICDYCNKEIYKSNKKRHLNSKECKEKQTGIINILEYKCKYCNKCFNLNDTKNKHELICNAKDIYYKLKHELELKEQELLSYKKNKEQELLSYKENKEYIIKKFQEETKEQKETITDLRSQLYVLQKVSPKTLQIL